MKTVLLIALMSLATINAQADIDGQIVSLAKCAVAQGANPLDNTEFYTVKVKPGMQVAIATTNDYKIYYSTNENLGASSVLIQNLTTKEIITAGGSIKEVSASFRSAQEDLNLSVRCQAK